MTIEDYLNSPSSEKVLLVVITSGANTYYFSDRPYITRSTDTPAGQPFHPYIAKNGLPRFLWKLPDQFGGPATKSYGDLTLHGGDYDGTDLRTLDLRGADVEVFITAPSDKFPFSDAQRFIKGIIGKQKASGKYSISLQITDRQNIFDSTRVPNKHYSTGAGLPGATQNSPIPVALGQLSQCKPTKISDSSFTFQLHDTNYGAWIGTWGVFYAPSANMRAFFVRDMGVELYELYGVSSVDTVNRTIQLTGTPSDVDGYYVGCEVFPTDWTLEERFTCTAYDGTTHTMTVAEDVTDWSGPAKIYTFIPDYTTGQFTLLQPPVGEVTVDVGVPPLLWSDFNHAAMVDWLLKNIAGFTAADIESLAGCATDTYVGLYLTQRARLSDIITMICKGCFSWWSFNRAGKFKMAPHAAPSGSPVHTYTSAHIAGEPSINDEDIYWKVPLKGARPWHQISQFAASVTADQRETLNSTDSDLMEDTTVLDDYPHAKASEPVDCFTQQLFEIKLGAQSTLLGLHRKPIIDVPMLFPLVELGDTIAIADYAPHYNGNWVVRSITESTRKGQPRQQLELWS